MASMGVTDKHLEPLEKDCLLLRHPCIRLLCRFDDEL